MDDPIKKVITEVPLSREQNIYGDCGPLCVQMLLKADIPETAEEYSLEIVRSFLKKEKMEATVPGYICEFFMFIGYEVEYYSTIDWRSCAFDPEKYYEKWDENLKGMIRKFRLNNPQGAINLEKFRCSARWLIRNALIIKPILLDPRRISKILDEGKRVIACVGCNHFVVVTGVDQDFFFFNNPMTKPRSEKMIHGKFMQWWNYATGTTEAIVAKPKEKFPR